MATPLDFELERHEGAEPRVVTEDVQRILRQVIRPGADDAGASVATIAAKAMVSTRTVYRVLNPEPDKLAIPLGLADKLAVAADSHLRGNVRLVWPDGRVSEYEV